MRFLPSSTSENREIQSKQEFKALRAPGNKIIQQPPAAKNEEENEVKETDQQQARPGFVVLGMHRSGTSMLSGLMVMGMGYKVGAPLIGGAYDNPKGFFELVPAVLQNDAFMGKQAVGWGHNVMNFDHEKAIEQYKNNEVRFKEGTKALSFLNDASKSPWLQKDPRMCITLKLWLELLDHEPAVLFTYRHPVEVANSLESREQSVEFFAGLRLWTAYNIRAIQNMRGLCVVRSTNVAILANPLKEVQRISDELTSKCNVAPPPKGKLDEDVVNEFFDPSLQHKKKSEFIESEELIRHGDCVVYDIKHGHDNRQVYQNMNYLAAMKLWCDLENGSAFEEDYTFPAI